MRIHLINSLDDPRVLPYRNLKDRELAAMGGLFIAEGGQLVQQLIDSDLPIESVLTVRKRLEKIQAYLSRKRANEDVLVYVVESEVMNDIVGYQFHSGMIGCGRRIPNASIDQIIHSVQPQTETSSTPMTVLICPEIINHDNLGALIRIGAAFGINAMILGERSCDPFWRRSVRVSMGAIFRLPIIRSNDLSSDLQRLRKEFSFSLAAAVIDDAANPLELTRRPPLPDRLGILVGNESQGLDDHWLQYCDQQITIPMRLGTDSLNVATAAAIILYHFTRIEPG